MNDSELTCSKTVPIKIERPMTEIDKLREEELHTTTTPNLSDDEKELDHDISTDGLSLLPRIGPRSREEKIIAYEEEIHRIVHEMNIDQCNLEYYESQERHYKGELDKLEQKDYPDPMAKVLEDHLIDELDRIQYEMFSKLGTGAEQTLRKKLRAVRIDNIGFQLSRLKPRRLSQEDLSPDSETKFLENEDSNGSFFPDNRWTLDDSFAASPAPSSVSISSYSRPWLRDHPASDVSAPLSQISTGSLPRPQSIKGKGEALQEKFKRIQHSLLPSTAGTMPIAVKFRDNSHHRSSSITKMNGESSPGSSVPHRPMPVCPIRSKSLTGSDVAISGTRDSTREKLNSSIDKGDLKEARSSLASSEERRQASLLSVASDATDEATPNGPYSPAHLSITDSDNIQDIIESVQSIIAKYDSNDYESFALTLQSVTHSPGHVRELSKRGVMEKLIRLLHGLDERRRFVFHNDLRERMTYSLYNIVRCIYSTDKLALQIHHNVSMVRDQCQRMLLNMAEPENIDQNELHSIRERISTGPFSQLSTFSYKHESIASLTNLGVLYAMSEYLVVDQRIVERLSEKDEPRKLVYIKRLICALLRNMTYSDHKNKVSICLLPEVMESLISQLDSCNEELLNSTASLLRNLAWNAEDVSKVALTKCNAIVGLVRALQRDIKQDSILVNITNGLVNLTQHSPDNKILFCAAPVAIQYMIKFLAYKSPDGNSRVIENITGLFCNVSQHIASTLDHMETIQQQGALDKLVSLLSNENNFVLMHVCGILNNLSASNPENVETLWKLRAPQYLEKLKQLDNSVVSERAGMVLQHLIIVKDGLEETDRDNCLLNGARMESVQDASLAFEDDDDINFNFEPEFSSPVHKHKIEVTKVKVKDGFHTPVKGDKMRGEDLLASTEKVPKYKDSLKRSLFKKISSIRKSSNPMDFEKAPNMQEVRFSLDTSPKCGSINSDTRSGSQSSVKTLVTNIDTHTPQNSPRRHIYPHSPYSHPHAEAYSHMIHANDVMPQYPYPNSYQSYPHHLIDPPTQPPPHIGYMHHYIPNYHQPHRYHHPLYSPHGSPSKHVPPHAYDSSLPLRPSHFPHPHIIPSRQQPYRMAGNPQSNQISRHDAAIIQARLDKYSKDRSYTDSQGDLVTDL